MICCPAMNGGNGLTKSEKINRELSHRKYGQRYVRRLMNSLLLIKDIRRLLFIMGKVQNF